MQRGLDLKTAAHKTGGGAAGHVVFFDQQGLPSAKLTLQGRRQSGVAGAYDHNIIFGHLSFLLCQIFCRLSVGIPVYGYFNTADSLVQLPAWFSITKNGKQILVKITNTPAAGVFVVLFVLYVFSLQHIDAPGKNPFHTHSPQPHPHLLLRYGTAVLYTWPRPPGDLPPEGCNGGQ